MASVLSSVAMCSSCVIHGSRALAEGSDTVYHTGIGCGGTPSEIPAPFAVVG